MKRKVILQALFALLWISTAIARVGDPPPVIDGETIYRSHMNYVEAVSVRSNNVVWKTVVYPDVEPTKYDPSLEGDVQLNIITSIELDGTRLRVRNSKGQIFFLNKSTGELIEPIKEAK